MTNVVRWTGREAWALRLASRMSVRAFAAHLGVTPATVSNWDARGSLAHLRTETAQLLDITLARASVEVLERFTVTLAGTDAEPANWPATRRVLPQRLPAAETPHADAMESTDRGPEVELIELATVLDQRSIGAGELTGAELAGAQLDRHFARLGPDEVLPRVQALMTAAVFHLRRPQPLEYRRRLCALAGRLAGLRGWLCFDLDEHREAEAWYDLAVTAAQEVEEWSLAAWLLGARSLIPSLRQDHRHAVTLIERGIYLAGNGADTTTRAWLQALHARGRAGLGDRHGFESANRRAERAAEQSTPRDRRHGMDFHHGVLDLRYYTGSSRLLLQQPAEAAHALRGSLAALPATHSKARAVLCLAIADAAAQDDRLDEAVELTQRALTSAYHQPILPILHQARRIHALVGRRQPAAADALTDDLARFAAALTTTAAGTPP